jgi:transcriptional regulator with XRE-family HTH domain
MTKKSTIGTRLREERERLSFSQEGFSAVAGSTKRTQLNHEKGNGTPTAAALAVWAAVGLDVVYVVTGERDGQAPPPPPSPEEQTLLAYWRGASKAVRGAALGALVGAGKTAQEPVDGKSGQGKVVRLVIAKKPAPKR